MLHCPDYLCTWELQGHLIEQEKQRLGLQSADVHDVLNHEVLFGEKGLCHTLYPSVRSRLIFLLDDGWDLPFSKQGAVEARPYYSCHDLCEIKFPGYGRTPAEKLKTLADNICRAGWRGAGLWIAAQETPARQRRDGTFDEDFWRERILWSREAGIVYWKIDWGSHYMHEAWRRFVSRTKAELYPELIIEHITSCTGLNDPGRTGRVPPAYIEDNIRFGSFSDVFRTYDVTAQLSKATTLDRTAEHLYGGYTEAGPALGLLNGEDEAYLCASLGLTLGIMRTAATSRRLNEAERAVRWHESAPAYEVGYYDTALSPEFLADDWEFREGDSWDAGARGFMVQRAPAAVARGCALPEVVPVPGGEKPFAAACRYPNGAFSIGVFGRTHGRLPYTPAPADVRVTVGALSGPVGIFGTYRSLTLRFDRDLTGLSVWAGDLMTGRLEDVTGRVSVDGDTLTLSGGLLSAVGLADGCPGDESEPGVLLRIGTGAYPDRSPRGNPRLPVWAVRNRSFEKAAADRDGAAYDEAAARPRAWLWKGETALAVGGHTGDWCGVHTAAALFHKTTWQEMRFLPEGRYTLTAFVRTAPIRREDGFARLEAVGGRELRHVDFGGGTDGWQRVTLENILVTGGELTVRITTRGTAGDEVRFDDISLYYEGA